MDEQAKIDYDGHLKSLAISNNVIETAMLEGKLLGEATGEARGEARGIAISEAKALTEKEVVVCNTFKHLNDIELVSKITTNSIDQVKEILRKNKLI